MKKIDLVTKLALWINLWAVGCKPAIQLHTPTAPFTHLSPFCQSAIKEVRENFFFDKKQNHYVMNPFVIHKLLVKSWGGNGWLSNPCLDFLSSNDIVDIFGKPSLMKNDKLYYILGYTSIDKNRVPLGLIFEHGADKKLKFRYGSFMTQ
jgi:hypothetical protein